MVVEEGNLGYLVYEASRRPSWNGLRLIWLIVAVNISAMALTTI